MARALPYSVAEDLAADRGDSNDERPYLVLLHSRLLSGPTMTMTKFLTTKRGHRVTKLALALVTTWVSGGLVACADNPASVVTAPAAPTVAPSVVTMPAPAASFNIRSARFLNQRVVGDTTVTQFRVTPQPRVTVFDIGNQSKILFPLGGSSICDPATSGYGAGLWDTACAPLSQPITITAKSWTNPVTGAVNTDFSPELRFVPGGIVGVTLFLHDSNPSLTDRIEYCSDGACVDDSKVDGTLITNRDGSGFVYRVIKHFSGYNVVVD